jgi:integrase
MRRRNKDGDIISYKIRVFRGRDTDGKQLKPYMKTWKPDEGMTARQIKEALNEQVVLFANQCKQGYDVDNKQTFAAYAAYVLGLKERNNVAKHRTINRYKELLERINPEIGHLKVADIRLQHLNELYKKLSGVGIRKDGGKATPKADINEIMKKEKLTRAKLSEISGISSATITAICQGSTVALKSATALCEALKMSMNKLFEVKEDNKTLSDKTILEHHRLIKTIFSQAEKEMLVSYNPAKKSTPPTLEKTEANYIDEEDIYRIAACLEKEPLKWQAAVHLLLITGARRGEILGLKWRVVDRKNRQIHICNNLLYSKERGIYEDSTKTKESRYVKLPVETMELLEQYKAWYDEQAKISGSKWEQTDFLFVQDNGKPMNPDSLTDYCRKFSERNGLPHINPHALRHTQASLLYFKGVDSISISKRLGHKNVSTTTDMYGHIMRKADEISAECVADVVFRRSKQNEAESEV